MSAGSRPRIVVDASFLRGAAEGANAYVHEYMKARIEWSIPNMDVALLGPSDLRSIWHDYGVFYPVSSGGLRGRLAGALVGRMVRPSAVHYMGNFELGLAGVASIVTIHDFMDWHYSEERLKGRSRGAALRKRLVQASIRRAAGVVVSNEVDRKRAERFASEHLPIVVAPPGPGPVTRLLPSGHAACVDRGFKDVDYLVMLGSVRPHKRFQDFSKAFETSTAKASGWRLVHVGRSLNGDLNGVTSVGRLDTREVLAVLLGARGLVMPSSYEGFGMPALEAAILGIPVISSPGVPALEAARGLAQVICMQGDLSRTGVDQAIEQLEPWTLRTYEERSRISGELWREHVIRVDELYAALVGGR